MNVHHFCLAEHKIRIIFSDSIVNGMELLSSFEPFRIESFDDEPLLELRVEEELLSLPAEQLKRVRIFDTGNGDTVVDHINTGGYQYSIEDISKNVCCLLQTDDTFSKCVCAVYGNRTNRTFGLNNALMLTFAFAAAKHDTLLIHASLVRNSERGFAFIAKSGTGKSTQVSMWLRYIPGSDLMNDDNPIVRIINGKAWIFGSPWSGKTPCYRNVKAELGAITRIERASANSIEKLGPVQGFASLLPSCASMKWDIDIYNMICNTITRLVEMEKLYTLHCLPNEEAARTCYDYFFSEKK